MKKQENLYKLVFSGKLVENLSIKQVKSNLRIEFQLTEDKVEKYFPESGKSIVVKRVATLDHVAVVRKKFEKLGMLLSVKEIERSLHEDSASPANTNISSNNINKKTPLSLVNKYKSALFLLLIAIAFFISYSPHLDGMLRIGFIAGFLFLYFAYRSYRTKLNQF